MKLTTLINDIAIGINALDIINQNYLTFTAAEAESTIQLTQTGSPTAVSLQYKLNESNWTDYNVGDIITLTNIDDYVQFKGSTTTFSCGTKKYYKFVMSGKIKATGNVMSLINYADLTDYCFVYLFNGCSSLIQTSKTLLPATKLANFCYTCMFQNCTALSTAFQLPATELTNTCYQQLFSYCSSLLFAPQLPATVLADNCYNFMFRGCSSLSTAPQLPATALAYRCYGNMFTNCTNLTIAPQLPATALANYCYSYMFQGCTNLSSVNNLNADILYSNSYGYMFSGCVNLQNPPKILATKLSGSQSCYGMFQGCTKLKYTPDLYSNDLTYCCYAYMFADCTSLTGINQLSGKNFLSSYCYSNMFNGCTNLIQAPKLPATTLNYACYQTMFSNCTSLTATPQLPATNLADWCYKWMFEYCTKLIKVSQLSATNLNNLYQPYAHMFEGCSSLTTPPALPASSIGFWSYRAMFQYCTSLTAVPELPATTLDEGCYSYMFRGCTSLTKVPNCLPATTLPVSCYDHMFESCINLTTAPILPATTLNSGSYNLMFTHDKKLNNIQVNFTDWNISGNATNLWLYNVANSGTFYKPTDLSTVYGDSYIPNNWTVIDLTDDVYLPQSSVFMNYVAEGDGYDKYVGHTIKLQGYSTDLPVTFEKMSDVPTGIILTTDGYITIPNGAVPRLQQGVKYEFNIKVSTPHNKYKYIKFYDDGNGVWE